MNEKTEIIGITREELAKKLVDIGIEAFRAKQIWHWVYVKGATDFAQMTTIAKKQHALLTEHFSITRPKISRALTSTDGTRKWLLEMPDSNKIEMVFIPEEDRGALCVSSQVGCTLSCSFCHTGTMPLVRNLTPADIIGQVLIARDGLDEWDNGTINTRENRLFTNIVMMGMGEPLYNYENVAKALKIVMDGEGIAISKRRITLSTSGVVPMIERCGNELGVNLAISLHAVRDDLRDELVPINKKYPIKELLEACHNYPAANNARRITFEYVMLAGVNDSDAEARELVRLLKGIHAKVNLIPFNPWGEVKYKCSSKNRMNSFANIVNDAGFSAPIRATRGQDIYAACGQLKSDSERVKGQKISL